MKKYISLFILFLIISCKIHPGSNKYDAGSKEERVYKLRLNPQIGTQYYYNITNKSEFKLEMNDQKIENQSLSNVGVFYKINKDSAGNFLLIMHYDRIHLHTENGNTETDMDANDIPNDFNPVQKMLSALKSAKIIATVTPLGDVKSVTGYKEIEAEIMADFSQADANSKVVAQSQLDQLIENKLVKRNVDQIFKIFPNSEIQVGDKWQLSSKQKDVINLNVKTTYTLNSIDNDIATIESESDMISDSTSSDLMGTKATANLKGKQLGKYDIEIKTGMVVKCKVSAKLSGTLQMLGREIPITIVSNVKMTGTQIK